MIDAIKRRLHFRNKEWVVYIDKGNTICIIEVTDEHLNNPTRILINLLKLAFEGYNYIHVEQKIDERQWGIKNRQEFITKLYDDDIIIQHSLQKDFCDSSIPLKEDRIYIINASGVKDGILNKKLVDFGTFNLPNIIYGLHSLSQFSFHEQNIWSNNVYKWFKLLSSKDELYTIINKTNLLVCTIDGHILLFVKEKEKVQSILLSIKNIGRSNNKRIKIIEKQYL